MTTVDVPAVVALADCVHPTFHEGEATFLDRLALFPEGCLALADGGGTVWGYAIAYPARLFEPPPLDTVLGVLPPEADTLYIHDVALAPECRGKRLAEPAIAAFLGLAEHYDAAMLVSVYGTPPFWARFGFAPVEDPKVQAKLTSYGADAVFMVRRRKGILDASNSATT